MALVVNRSAVRAELRDRAAGPNLRRRRAIAALAAAGLADAAVISLYQLGVLRHLPDPPGFASDDVAGSPDAYAFGVPDGTLAAAQLAGILLASAAGGARRGGRPAILDGLLAALALGGTLTAAFKTWKAVVREGRLCAWCLPLAAINAAALALSLPGVLPAVERRS